MKFPLVSRAALDAITAELRQCQAKLAVAEREADRWELEAKRSYDLVAVLRDEGKERIADLSRRLDLATASEAEAHRRLLDITAQMTAPRPIVQNAPAPEFKDFPAEVASALAVATAGFRKDQQREIYEWTAAQLAGKVPPAEVAASLRNGLPVHLDPMELS